jgi:hypothetical protein
MAYEVKVQALTTLGKSAQARALLEETLAQGRAAHRLDTEAQVQTQLGEIELKLGDQRKGVRDLEAAGTLAQRYGFHRITAEAMFDLYGAYRPQPEPSTVPNHRCGSSRSKSTCRPATSLARCRSNSLQSIAVARHLRH